MMLDWALYYARLGWAVFPLVPGTKSPFAGSHGSSEATTDEATIRAWWTAHPDANIGTRPSAAGLYVYDVDPRNGGDADHARLEAEHGPLVTPLIVNSPGGGWHAYLAAPPGQRYNGKPADGIDGKYNGYAVLPPSVHPNGGRYAWHAGPPTRSQVAGPIPQWLVRPVVERPAVKVDSSIEDVDRIQAALDKLDPDDYHQWTEAMASVKHWEDTGGEALQGVGYEVMRAWSARSAKHDDGAFEDKWQTWDSWRPGARTLGSLLHDAGMTAAQQMVNAASAFASAPVEQQQEMWSDTPMVTFPERRAPDDVASDLMTHSPFFQQACAADDVGRMAWVAARIYPGEHDKALAVLTTLGFPDTADLRAVVHAAMSEVKPALPVELSDGSPLSKAPVRIEESPFYGAEHQAQLFAGCVVIPSANAVLLPNGELLPPEGFNASMPAGSYALSEKKVVDKPWQALVSSQFMRWPRAQAVGFRPDLPSLCLYDEEGRTMVNGYIPHVIRATAGDASPFLQHLVKLVPDARDREILLSWMAAVAQNPGRKFRWAPVLQGCEGNGKGLVASVMQHVVGRRYTHMAQAADLANKFNAWLVSHLLVIVNEADLRRDQEIIDAVKPMITDDYVAVQGKGKDQETGRNFANFMLTTNHLGAVGKAVKGRRYSVFVTPQQTDEDLAAHGMTGGYFADLVGWLNGGGYETVAQFLLDYPIHAEFNPATTCVNAPRTSGFAATVDAAKGSVEQVIEEAIKEGRKGFRTPFVCSSALADLLKELRKDNAVAPNKRRELMQGLGYDWHPSLREGRASRVIAQSSGVRPVIFVRKDHPIYSLNNAHEIMDRFEKSLSPFIIGADQAV